jgi:hypothetical protein
MQQIEMPTLRGRRETLLENDAQISISGDTMGDWVDVFSKQTKT